MSENNSMKKENFENFMSTEALENYRNGINQCSMFLAQNGKRKIWQPAKLKFDKTPHLAFLISDKS